MNRLTIKLALTCSSGIPLYFSVFFGSDFLGILLSFGISEIILNIAFLQLPFTLTKLLSYYCFLISIASYPSLKAILCCFLHFLVLGIQGSNMVKDKKLLVCFSDGSPCQQVQD